MAKLEDEEDQHLATLHELEATQEEISTYQGLLKNIPEIYERKFNERLKPILDRNQQLIDEREQLLHQLRHALPATREEPKMLPSAPPASPPLAPELTPPQRPLAGKRPWWLVAVASGGLLIGFLLNKAETGKTPMPGSPPSPASSQRLQPPIPAGQPPQSPRSKLVELALAEWRLFGEPMIRDGRLVHAGRKEGDPGQWQRVATYWREGLLQDPPRSSAEVSSSDRPWSAAFISYVMKRAGAGERFPYAASHSGTINEAIYNRQQSLPNARLKGYRVTEYAPRAGDLLCAPRGWSIGQVTYDNAGRFDFFPSRCELVIGATSIQIVTIGGDLLDSVTLRKIKAVNGKIAPESVGDWLAVIHTDLDV
ncbi:MAG: DUF2272 domain-containing protein [Cyanobacteriota bacterium]|nr:DUF2272 domain-containing protein [Cyanobacteriota bacterium]